MNTAHLLFWILLPSEIRGLFHTPCCKVSVRNQSEFHGACHTEHVGNPNPIQLAVVVFGREHPNEIANAGFVGMVFLKKSILSSVSADRPMKNWPVTGQVRMFGVSRPGLPAWVKHQEMCPGVWNSRHGNENFFTPKKRGKCGMSDYGYELKPERDYNSHFDV